MGCLVSCCCSCNALTCILRCSCMCYPTAFCISHAFARSGPFLLVSTAAHQYRLVFQSKPSVLPLLAAAVDDFSKAIEIVPQYTDAWKRRGQARAALGELNSAAQVVHIPHAVKLACTS